jgi:hypothetical protein
LVFYYSEFQVSWRWESEVAAPKNGFRVRAALACKIVQLDRLKFNDAVASGVYPCAPATTPGSARLFDEERLLPLYFFARLTEFGVSAATAGRIACEMSAAARADNAEKADRIVLVRGTHGDFCTPSFVTFPANLRRKPDTYDPEHEKRGIEYPAIGRVIFTVEFYVKHVREIIAEALAFEASILGREDDE